MYTHIFIFTIIYIYIYIYIITFTHLFMLKLVPVDIPWYFHSFKTRRFGGAHQHRVHHGGRDLSGWGHGDPGADDQTLPGDARPKKSWGHPGDIIGRISRRYPHTHTHTYIYIYIYTHMVYLTNLWYKWDHIYIYIYI